MKKYFVLSACLNILFIVVLLFIVIKLNGVSYLRAKAGFDIKEKPSWYFKNYQHWKETKSLYEVLPNDSNEIIFIGNSITFGCEWAELFSNHKIKNRGIGGDSTEGILARLGEITESKPVKIFMNIGTNDLALGLSIDEILDNYSKIIDNIKSTTPVTEIYIQSVLPTRNRPERSNDSINVLNLKLEQLAQMNSINYLNIHEGFTDIDGSLREDLSLDGLHLLGEGYLIWKDLIQNEVNK